MACKHMHVVNNVIVNTGSSTVVLNFTVPATAENKDTFCFKIPCQYAIPSSAAAYTVYATINGATVPVWDKYGNPATGNLFRTCKGYKGYFGGTTAAPHLIVPGIPFTCNTACGNIL